MRNAERERERERDREREKERKKGEPMNLFRVSGLGVLTLRSCSYRDCSNGLKKNTSSARGPSRG